MEALDLHAVAVLPEKLEKLALVVKMAMALELVLAVPMQELHLEVVQNYILQSKDTVEEHNQRLKIRRK